MIAIRQIPSWLFAQWNMSISPRPDSVIHGVNVHAARKRMGRRLAQEFQHEADIVVGAEFFSLSAASGFPRRSLVCQMKWA